MPSSRTFFLCKFPPPSLLLACVFDPHLYFYLLFLAAPGSVACTMFSILDFLIFSFCFYLLLQSCIASDMPHSRIVYLHSCLCPRLHHDHHPSHDTYLYNLRVTLPLTLPRFT